MYKNNMCHRNCNNSVWNLFCLRQSIDKQIIATKVGNCATCKSGNTHINKAFRFRGLKLCQIESSSASN